MRGFRLIAGIVVAWALLFAPGCKSKTETAKPVDNSGDELRRLQSLLGACEQDKKSLEEEMNRLMRDLAGKDAEVARWRDAAESSNQTSSKLQKELEEFAKRTPGTRAIDGGVLFEDALLYDSGKADLKAGGKAALDKLADLLRGKNAVLRVEGHTDADPIQKSASLWRTRDNFELAAYRALSVTLYLKSRGIPGGNMYLASYGEHKRIAENDTKENKARNRRVEVYIFDQG